MLVDFFPVFPQLSYELIQISSKSSEESPSLTEFCKSVSLLYLMLRSKDRRDLLLILTFFCRYETC